MGLLDSNRLQRMLGRAFKGVYGSGVILREGKSRSTNGTLTSVLEGRYPVRFQLDQCTESMKREEGYASTDMRVIILRDGLQLDLTQFSSDCKVIAGGFEWGVSEFNTDPARAYFEARGSMRKPIESALWEEVDWSDADGVVDWFMSSQDSEVLKWLAR